MSTEKKTRYRRTKADITEDIRKAAVDQVLKRGFSASLVTEIIKKAKIEPPVFYHRYKNIDEFYSEFVKGCDYWFSDIADKAMKGSDNPREQFLALMEGLQEALKEKSVMHELLRWEIAEGNDTTKRTATLREMFTLPLADKYNALFADTGIDFVALASLLIGGLYYLHLHRERSTFCNIDMEKEEGIQRIEKAIKTFTNIIFSFLERRDTKQDVAERMRAKGIDEQTIAEQLSMEDNILLQRIDSLETHFILDNLDNVLGPCAFQMMTSTYNYPVLTPQIEEIMGKATDKFRADRYVSEYYTKAKEIMARLKGEIDDAPVTADSAAGGQQP